MPLLSCYFMYSPGHGHRLKGINKYRKGGAGSMPLLSCYFVHSLGHGHEYA